MANSFGFTKPVLSTRRDGLGYQHQAPSLWRLIDLETGSPVGPQYRSKGELLADLDGGYAALHY